MCAGLAAVGTDVLWLNTADWWIYRYNQVTISRFYPWPGLQVSDFLGVVEIGTCIPITLEWSALHIKPITLEWSAAYKTHHLRVVSTAYKTHHLRVVSTAYKTRRKGGLFLNEHISVVTNPSARPFQHFRREMIKK